MDYVRSFGKMVLQGIEMKLKILTLKMGIPALAMMPGCHKKAAMATPPAPPPPVRESAPPPPERREPPARVAQTPAPEPPAPAAQVRTSKLIEDYLNRLLDAYFDYNKAELRTDARTALNNDSSQLRTLLKEFPTAKFVVEGNCDERGSPEYNLALGARRAKAAYEFLTQIGVPAERPSTVRYGKA